MKGKGDPQIRPEEKLTSPGFHSGCEREEKMENVWLVRDGKRSLLRRFGFRDP